jgi:hypothetical protein
MTGNSAPRVVMLVCGWPRGTARHSAPLGCDARLAVHASPACRRRRSRWCRELVDLASVEDHRLERLGSTQDCAM